MLNKALIANAVFSFLSGLLMLLTQQSLQQQVPLPGWLWSLIGVGLIGFSVQLLLMAKNIEWAQKLTASVVVSDLLWVLATTIAVMLFGADISASVIVAVMMVNLLVALLAWFQYLGYRQSFAT